MSDVYVEGSVLRLSKLLEVTEEAGAGEADTASLSFAATSLLRRLLFLPALMTSNARC